MRRGGDGDAEAAVKPLDHVVGDVGDGHAQLGEPRGRSPRRSVLDQGAEAVERALLEGGQVGAVEAGVDDPLQGATTSPGRVTNTAELTKMAGSISLAVALLGICVPSGASDLAEERTSTQAPGTPGCMANPGSRGTAEPVGAAGSVRPAGFRRSGLALPVRMPRPRGASWNSCSAPG